jgi:mRNA interferase MazF
MCNLNIYDQWNNDKKKIQTQKKFEFFVNIREIWFTKMGKNIGFEEDGKKSFLRPVLVIKKIGNLFFTVALTTKGKNESNFYHKFKEIELHNPKYKNSSYAILSQVKVMDKKRFVEHIGNVSKEEFSCVKQKLKALLL